jgi:hypothetical protein
MPDLTKLARKKLYANLIGKLNKGKTLTANERNQLEGLSIEFDPDKKDHTTKPQEPLTIDGVLEAGEQTKLRMFQQLSDQINTGKAELTPHLLAQYRALEAEVKKLQGPSARVFAGSEEVAEFVKCTRQAVNRAVAAKKLRRQDDGTYLMQDVEAWEGSRSARGRPSTKASTSEDADKRYRIAKAEKMELELKELMGDLLDRKAVEKAFTARAYEFQRGLLMVSRRISAQVAGKCKKLLREVENIIDEEHRRLLEEYSRPMAVETKKSQKK